jgi:hypothetical protein
MMINQINIMTPHLSKRPKIQAHGYQATHHSQASTLVSQSSVQIAASAQSDKHIAVEQTAIWMMMMMMMMMMMVTTIGKRGQKGARMQW